MLDLGIKKFERFRLPEEIIGEKIVLKRRAHEHDTALFALIDGSREILREFLFWVDDTQSVEDVKKVTDIFAKNWDECNSFEYVFLDRQSGKMVGAGGIHTVCYMNRMAEYGYYLDKDARGNGYASEFVQLMEKELFARGIHRLVIECDEKNAASAAVAQRNGFLFEGVLRDAKYAYGTYRNEMVFAKINGEDR